MEVSFDLSSAPIDQDLPFSASYAFVDNYSRRWVYLPTANRWCPPGRTGLLFALPRGRRARALFLPPPDIPDGVNLPGQIATILFTDEP